MFFSFFGNAHVQPSIYQVFNNIVKRNVQKYKDMSTSLIRHVRQATAAASGSVCAFIFILFSLLFWRY